MERTSLSFGNSDANVLKIALRKWKQGKIEAPPIVTDLQGRTMAVVYMQRLRESCMSGGTRRWKRVHIKFAPVDAVNKAYGQCREYVAKIVQTVKIVTGISARKAANKLPKAETFLVDQRDGKTIYELTWK